MLVMISEDSNCGRIRKRLYKWRR